jgi:hypothetical protein
LDGETREFSKEENNDNSFKMVDICCISSNWNDGHIVGKQRSYNINLSTKENIMLNLISDKNGEYVSMNTCDDIIAALIRIGTQSIKKQANAWQIEEEGKDFHYELEDESTGKLVEVNVMRIDTPDR